MNFLITSIYAVIQFFWVLESQSQKFCWIKLVIAPDTDLERNFQVRRSVSSESNLLQSYRAFSLFVWNTFTSSFEVTVTWKSCLFCEPCATLVELGSKTNQYQSSSFLFLSMASGKMMVWLSISSCLIQLNTKLWIHILELIIDFICRYASIIGSKVLNDDSMQF